MVQCANADAAADKKRAQLLTVKRLVVVPAFFGTDTLGELPPKKEAAGHNNRSDADEKHRAANAEYVDTLKQLETNVRERLPARAAARTPFEIAKADDVNLALKNLSLSPPELFTTGGRLNSKKFDSPEPDKCKKLAAALHADAVLTCVFDEPRSSNGTYFFDPLSGVGYDSPKVHDKATFDLMLADGTLVLRQTIDVVHPLTSIGKRKFVAADWIETDDQIIEDFMDEVTRYTPKR